MDKEDKLFRKRFFSFLKENNAYDKWIYNLRKRNPSNEIWWWNDFYQILYEDRCLRAIICAFFWGNTKEGLYFWSELNHKWHDYILDLIEQKETLYD